MALKYAIAGIAVFPCRPNKQPATAHGFKDATTDVEQVRRMFSGGDYLIGIPTGEIVAIDVEDEPTARALELDFDRACLGPFVCQKTPSEGRHYLFKTSVAIRNEKLARGTAGGKAGLLIETRGHGGYICTGGPYQWLNADLTEVTTLTAEQTEDVLAIARSFDRLPKERKPSLQRGVDVSPGDDFNRRGDWQSLLTKHGWQHATGTRWRRPGKTEGISANWLEESRLFHVFSSNAEPLEGGSSYSPFALFATLEHKGDYSQAASVLAGMGYGRRATTTTSESTASDDANVTVEDENRFDELFRRRFSAANPPPPLEPILLINGIPVGTGGNIALLGAQAGSGKSRYCAAIIGSSVGGIESNGDFLGWQCHNPMGKAVIYLDFEQSAQDHFDLIKGALRRAGADVEPDWLYAHHLTGVGPVEGLAFLKALLNRVSAKHGGVLIALIDGIADLCQSPNDEQEAFELIRQIHALAGEYDCLVFGILHHNAQQEGAKMRGHLGSQAERKAETVFQLKRDSEEAITLSTTKARHRRITEQEGPRFQWCDDFGDFVTIKSKAEVRSSIKDDESRILAKDLFAVERGLTYAAAIERIIELTGKSESTAKRRLGEMRASGFVKVQSGTGYYHEGDRK